MDTINNPTMQMLHILQVQKLVLSNSTGVSDDAEWWWFVSVISVRNLNLLLTRLNWSACYRESKKEWMRE